jgi:hypothetical protein
MEDEEVQAGKKERRLTRIGENGVAVRHRGTTRKSDRSTLLVDSIPGRSLAGVTPWCRLSGV